jgi:hypothetical protein
MLTSIELLDDKNTAEVRSIEDHNIYEDNCKLYLELQVLWKDGELTWEES